MNAADERLTDILSRIAYKDWEFRIGVMGSGQYLQVRFDTPAGETWSGRKWYISPYATVSEIVQTALKAVLTAEEHEAREKFLYRGKAIFGPHLDVETLVAMADETEVRA